MKNKSDSNAEGTSAAPGAPKTPQRILLVDDDGGIRHVSTTWLIGSGFHVDIAEDGEAAWNALQTKDYDLLITDNNMPKVSGIELVHKLRAARMALPVILASGAINVEVRRNPILNLAATLEKPFTGEELLEAVKKVLYLTRATGEPLPNSQSQPSSNDLLF